MFFENDAVSFHILDVLRLKQTDFNKFHSGRNFSALSFRIHADTCLKANGSEYHMGDHYVSYVPAGLDYTRVSKVDELIAIHFDATNCHTENIEFFLPDDADKFRKLFEEILDRWNRKDVGYRYKCTALLYDIFAECYLQNFRSDFQNSKIQGSIEYISKNFKNKDLSIAQIARQSFMSEVYFRKLFKEKFGISPKKYIIRLRIQNAISLIAAGYYSLGEVADMSGYSDYKHFSVEFKKVTGVSPSKYLYDFHM